MAKKDCFETYRNLQPFTQIVMYAAFAESRMLWDDELFMREGKRDFSKNELELLDSDIDDIITTLSDYGFSSDCEAKVRTAMKELVYAGILHEEKDAYIINRNAVDSFVFASELPDENEALRNSFINYPVYLLLALTYNNEKTFLSMLDRWEASPDDLDYILMEAVVRTDNIRLVTALLEKGADVNYTDKDGYTPLLNAAHYNTNPQIIEALLSAGADISARLADGSSILHLVSAPAVLSTILKYCPHDLLEAKDNEGATPLFSASPKTVELLLSAGADIGAVMNNGINLLHDCAGDPDASVWNALFAHAPASLLNALDEDKWTPLCFVTKSVEILNSLLSAGADVNVRGKGGESVLHCLAARATAEVVREFVKQYPQQLEAVDEDGETPLLTAARRNRDSEVIDVLLEAGANIEAVSKNGDSILHFATRNPCAAVLQKVLQLVPESIVNKADENTLTPLMLFLLDADDSYDEIGNFFALINRGADVTMVDAEGGSVLHYAAGNNKSGASFYVHYLLSRELDVNARTKNKKTPLMSAAVEGTIKTCRLLLESGADINAVDDEKNTVWDYALANDESSDRYIRLRLLLV